MMIVIFISCLVNYHQLLIFLFFSSPQFAISISRYFCLNCISHAFHLPPHHPHFPSSFLTTLTSIFLNFPLYFPYYHIPIFLNIPLYYPYYDIIRDDDFTIDDKEDLLDEAEFVAGTSLISIYFISFCSFLPSSSLLTSFSHPFLSFLSFP